MSDSLNEFALKVASALDAYAAKGDKSISLHNVPFHLSMMKMAQALKHRQSSHAVKTAFWPGAAAGLLGGVGLARLSKWLRPMGEEAVLGAMKPADILGRGVTGVAQQAGKRPGVARDALLDALMASPAGREAAEQIGRLGGEKVVRPWQMGAVGLGGLAGGQYLTRDRGTSGPPMIIA